MDVRVPVVGRAGTVAVIEPIVIKNLLVKVILDRANPVGEEVMDPRPQLRFVVLVPGDQAHGRAPSGSRPRIGLEKKSSTSRERSGGRAREACENQSDA